MPAMRQPRAALDATPPTPCDRHATLGTGRRPRGRRAATRFLIALRRIGTLGDPQASGAWLGRDRAPMSAGHGCRSARVGSLEGWTRRGARDPES